MAAPADDFSDNAGYGGTVMIGSWLRRLALAAVVLHGVAHAQGDAFPSKPIRFVVCCTGFPEAVARVVGEQIAEATKHQVVIDPKPGANGILAAEYVAKAPADGYTLLIGTNSTHAANQSLYKQLNYDYVKDFVPVTALSQGALMLAVNPSLPAKNVAELTALAKKDPGKLVYGYASSSTRAAMEQYKQMAGVQIQDVPYKTLPQATTDLLGGRLDLMIGDMVSLPPHVQSGKLRALAVTGPKRMPAFPDVPTLDEAGVKGYVLTFWLGAWAPAGTPPAVVQKLNEMIVAALKSPRVTEFLVKAGSEPFPTTSAELMKFQVSEQQKWNKILTTAGIQPE
jgi:tripartite-type tricarboxylate transporter receptor subunit TctC